MYQNTINKLLKSGFYLIPIQAGTKLPVGAWKTIKTFTDTDYQDWEQNGLNVAIYASRSGFVVVDIDAYKNVQHFNHSEVFHDAFMCVRTPRGGYHYYYKAKGSFIQTSYTELGIDIRYEGYALCPPSIGYEFLWENGSNVAISQEELERRLPIASPSKPVEEIPHNNVGLLEGVLISGFTEGKHNQELLELSRLLSRAMFGSTPELKHSVAIQLLKYLDNRDATPQGERQLLATYQSAVSYEMEKLGIIPLPDDTVRITESPIINLTDAQALKQSDSIWLIEGVLPQKGLIFVTGTPGSMKSWLTLYLTYCVSSGNPFAGVDELKVNEVGSSIFVQLEDDPFDFAQRLIQVSNGELPEQSWGFIPTFNPNDGKQLVIPSISSDQSIDDIMRVVIDNNLKVIVIDPFSAISSDTENFYASTANPVRALKRRLTAEGCLGIILHHSRKGAGTEREGMFGSNLLNGAVDGIIRMRKPEENASVVIVEGSGKKFGKGFNCTLRFNFGETFSLEIVEGSFGTYQKSIELDSSMTNLDRIMAILTESLIPLTVKEIASRTSLNEKVVSNILRQEYTNGNINRDSEGNKHVYYCK